MFCTACPSRFTPQPDLGELQPVDGRLQHLFDSQRHQFFQLRPGVGSEQPAARQTRVSCVARQGGEVHTTANSPAPTYKAATGSLPLSSL